MPSLCRLMATSTLLRRPTPAHARRREQEREGTDDIRQANPSIHFLIQVSCCFCNELESFVASVQSSGKRIRSLFNALYGCGYQDADSCQLYCFEVFGVLDVGNSRLKRHRNRTRTPAGCEPLGKNPFLGFSLARSLDLSWEARHDDLILSLNPSYSCCRH